MSSQHVSVFGIGNMGAALAKALLKAGFQLTIWNRTADRPQVASLVQAGAHYESDLHAAIRKSDGILLFCVVDYKAMYKLLESGPSSSSDASLLSGKTVVNVTNGTPKQAVAMDSWIKARGAAHYIDGSVLVTPEMIATPHALLVYSGADQTVFDKHARPVLQALGEPLYLGGAVDAAAAQDLAMLSAMYGLFQGALIGFHILQRTKGENGEERKIAPGTERVTAPILAALTPLLNRMATTIDTQNWSDNGGNPLAMMLAGLDNITEAAGDVQVNADGLVVFADAMRRAVADGHGDGDFSVTSKYLLK